MSDLSQLPSGNTPKSRRNNFVSEQALMESIPRSFSPSLESINSLQKDVDESKISNRYTKIIDHVPANYSFSSLSSSSSHSESSSSLEIASSYDQLSEGSADALDDAPNPVVKKPAPVSQEQPKKARLWSYIKTKIFKKDLAGNIDDEQSDLPIYFNWTDVSYSVGTTKLIKKLTNLYMMLCDPEVGIKSNSFSGEELYKWILNNFESQEDDFISFLGKQTDLDETDALTICNVIFLGGFIVPLDKSLPKFVLNNSEYTLQLPQMIPLASGVPSDDDYARYLIRRGNSNKFKLQDYELKALEEYKKTMKSIWKELESLAQKDTAAFRKRSNQEINVFKLQQQTFWRVYKPDPNSYDFYNLGHDAVRRRRKVIPPKKDLNKQPRLKIGKACKYLKDYCLAVGYIDPCFQISNPWISGDISVWESEPPVSHSQIKLWTTGIYYLLNDARGVQEFHKYLKKEFSHENLNFILACRDLETKVILPEFSLLAKQIFKDFIMEGSPFEINIVSTMRNQLIAVLEPSIANGSDLKSEDYDIFSDAVSHILTLLEKDPYKRYCKLLQSKLPGSRSSRKIVSKNQNLKSNSNLKYISNQSVSSLRNEMDAEAGAKFTGNPH